MQRLLVSQYMCHRTSRLFASKSKFVNLIKKRTWCSQGAEKPKLSETSKTVIDAVPKKRRWGRMVLLTLVAGSGGTLVYCYYNPQFREMVEENVPYSSDLFKMVIPNQNSIDTLKPLDQIKSAWGKVMPGEKDVDKALNEVVDKIVEKSEKSVEKLGKADEKVDKKVDVIVDPDKAKKEIDKKVKDRERLQDEENRALEKALEKLGESVKEKVKNAVEKQREASSAVIQHVSNIRAAMSEAQSEEAWKRVSALLETRNSTVELAEKFKLEAQKELSEFNNKFGAARENEVTKRNKAIKSSQNIYSSLLKELNASTNKLSLALSDLHITKEYKKLVEEGKDQLKKEMESIVPDVKIGETGKDLSKDELNSLIAFAHRRLEQLHHKLAEHLSEEGKRLEIALGKQKEDDLCLSDERVRQEVERQKLEDKKKLEDELITSRLSYERDIREQLKRQAAAHSDHLMDILSVQYKEQEDKFKDELNNLYTLEKERVEGQLGSALNRLRGIEAAVDARARLEREGLRAQELWLCCQALLSAVLFGDPGRESLPWEERLKPLADIVMACKQYSSNDVFAQAMLDKLPHLAKTRGVYSEEALYDRFNKVERVCRRVALIDERGGNVFKYLISHIQSWFIINSGGFPPLEDVSVDELDTFHILHYTRTSLEEGDLAQATLLMNQLSGEPRRVAAGWVKEARTLLEVRQIARLLTSHAAATHIISVEGRD